MATGFNTQVGSGEYRLQFETTDKQHFELMQAIARLCVDLAGCDKCRAKMDGDSDA